MHKINLIVEPKTKPMAWKEFVKKTPAMSIALDGYVDAASAYNLETKHLNFDHHAGVNRSATRATCGQVLLALRQGLFDSFVGDVNVYVNDCDEDVCLSYYLLKHGYRSKNVVDPLLNRLVFMIDMLDTTAGAYPFPADLPVLEELAWIFEPYRRARLNGLLGTKDSAAFLGIITDVERRITDHICGKGERISLNTSYEILSKQPTFVIVNETGSHARTGMLSDGIKAFVTVRQREPGTYDYVVGKISDFISFPIEVIFKKLNEAEGCTNDRWGGASTIGGSPRVGGSKLTLSEVEQIIAELLKN
jgi:hypothetical protein